MSGWSLTRRVIRQLLFIIGWACAWVCFCWCSGGRGKRSAQGDHSHSLPRQQGVRWQHGSHHQVSVVELVVRRLAGCECLDPNPRAYFYLCSIRRLNRYSSSPFRYKGSVCFVATPDASVLSNRVNESPRSRNIVSTVKMSRVDPEKK